MKERMAKALALAGISLAAIAAPVPVEQGRVAVVYFSWSPGGNTRFAARTIAERAQAKLYEIRAATPYPSEYRACTEEAKKECREQTLRPIVPLELPWDDFDVIFVGTPVWWGTMAPPVRTWLVRHREILKTKTLCVFQTHGGGGEQRVGRDFAEVMAGARLLDSAFFSGGGIQNRVGELQAFVDQRITLVAPQATEEGWDKVFPLSPKVEHDKVSFRNHFGITLAADLYKPRDARGRLPAVAVSGPFGAVKEQVSGLYAMRLAERGFLAVAFDPSYTGESGGEPRGVNSPDLNTEDFQAALDYLLTRDDVEEESLGVVGVCGWGGFALNVAAIDSRLRAAVAVTMYDMSQLHAGGYQDAQDNAAARHARRQELNRQRTRDARQGTYAVSPGFPSPMPEDAPQFLKDYYDFYCTPRGYHPRSIGSNGGWLVQTATSLLNARLLAYAREIQAPVLLVHGENAHSRYFSETAFQKMTGEKPAFPPGGFSCRSGNKELLLVPGAVHCDLYDERAGAIPFDRIADFLRQNLEKQP